MPEESTLAQSIRQVVRYAQASIEVISGVDRGLACTAKAGPVRIGTSANNDLVLTDETVSRYHVEISPTAHGVRVRDVDSTNGVVAGGTRILDAIFAANVDLRLGSSVVRVTLLAEGTERELSDAHRFGDVLGSSPRMRALFADLERIAPKDVSLLVEGETGTGKEVVAESVHRNSSRTEGPFVVFDCSAVVPNLIESALYGHEKGAFTGAVAAHAGVFEQAHKGTIFLDELGELPLELQPRLLRVLQKREVTRIGAQRTVPVDVRVIAATNRNLMLEVQQRRFREDLYYRVAATHVLVPPLRERLEDIPYLVEYFLSQTNPPQSSRSIPSDVWAMFRAHRWPGNVRELQNTLQRFSVMPERLFLGGPSTSVPAGGQTLPSPALKHLPVARREAAEAFERAYLEELLRQAKGNVSAAVALAGVSRQMLYRVLNKHRIDTAESEDSPERSS